MLQQTASGSGFPYIIAKAKAFYSNGLITPSLVSTILKASTNQEIKTALQRTHLEEGIENWDPKTPPEVLEKVLMDYYVAFLKKMAVPGNLIISSLQREHLLFIHGQNLKKLFNAFAKGHDLENLNDKLIHTTDLHNEEIQRIKKAGRIDVAIDYILDSKMRSHLKEAFAKYSNYDAEDLAFALSNAIDQRTLTQISIYSPDPMLDNMFHNFSNVLRLKYLGYTQDIPLLPSKHEALISRVIQASTAQEGFALIYERIEPDYKELFRPLAHMSFLLRLSLFEAETQRFLLNRSKQASYNITNPLHAYLGFLNIIRAEIYDVVRIVVGKNNGLSLDDIRESLIILQG